MAVEKRNIYIIADNFIGENMNYYGFNYVEGGKEGVRTDFVKILKNHPIFQKAEPPKPRNKWWRTTRYQKYVLTAELSPKFKTEYGAKHYTYEPDVEIQNLERVKQCWTCQGDNNNKYNYEPCNCSCDGLEDKCLCYPKK